MTDWIAFAALASSFLMFLARLIFPAWLRIQPQTTAIVCVAQSITAVLRSWLVVTGVFLIGSIPTKVSGLTLDIDQLSDIAKES